MAEPTTATASAPHYRAAGFFLLRVPTLPAAEALGVTQPADLPGPAGETMPARLHRLREDGRGRLREIAARPRTGQALYVASASLMDALARQEGRTSGHKKVTRLYSSLLRYITRMSTRPTPYGLFSAVGVGTFDAATALTLAADPVAATRTRADVGWLLALIKEIEGDRNLVEALRVTVNPLLYRVGDRAVLSFADVHGQEDNRQIGFRVTAPVATALRLAAIPGTTYADVVEGVRAEAPGTAPERVRGLVSQLWDMHVLISDLRPALTTALPEQDLVKRLDGLEGCADVQAGLRTARSLASAVDEAQGADNAAGLRELTAHQRGLTPGYTRETYQLDSALATTRTELSEEVGRTAAEAADLLMRLSSAPRRHHHIVEYHGAFLERYGVNAEVPVLELLSPEFGMEAPASYTSPPRSYPLPSIPEDDTRQRDALLTAVVTEALHRGQDEIDLSDDTLDRLTGWRPKPDHPRMRPSLDLYVQLAARSREALDNGDWQMTVSPGSTTDGGRTFGRFFDLFTEESLAQLVDYARAEEALCPDAVFAELSYVPPHGRGGNVMIHPPLRRYEICVNTSPSVPAENQIALTDIVVGATADRFYLRSRRLGKEVVVTQSHMLSQMVAPNVCRLLIELSQDGFATLPGFDWGLAVAAPYLPRLRRGRIVLHPAQWSLSARLLGLAADAELPDADGFFAAVQEWRRAWRVPRHAYLVWADNRLLLDLDHPLCVDELRVELRRAMRADRRSRLILQEMLPDFSRLWLTDGADRGYLNEIVVPLLASDEKLVRRLPIGSAAAPRTDLTGGPEPARRQLVGSEWIYLKLYSAVSQHDDIIVGPIPELVAELHRTGLVDRWFYIRYADPQPHLRLRIHVSRLADVPAVMARCMSWAHGLVAAGLASDLAFASYDRETERYGGPAMIDLAEEVFAANSHVSAGLIDLLRRHSSDLDPDVVCVLAMHAFCRDWGIDPVGEIRPGSELEASEEVRKQFRTVQPVLCDLLEPWADRPEAVARQYADALDGVLSVQSDVVARAGARARQLAADGRLAAGERTVLGSLLHMQVNRLLGMDQHRETRCHELWSLARRSIQRRPTA